MNSSASTTTKVNSTSKKDGSSSSSSHDNKGKSANVTISGGKISLSQRIVLTESAFDGKKITGILAIPRFSINGNAYLPEELARGHGKVVPLFWDHEWKKGSGEKKSIGEMILSWDGAKQQLSFSAIIKSVEAAKKIAANIKHLGASLGATFGHMDKVCGRDRCYNVPHELNFIEGSITDNPSMPETTGTLVLVESIQFANKKHESKHKISSSGNRCSACHISTNDDSDGDGDSGSDSGPVDSDVSEDDGVSVNEDDTNEDDGVSVNGSADPGALGPKDGGNSPNPPPVKVSEDDGVDASEDDGVDASDDDSGGDADVSEDYGVDTNSSKVKKNEDDGIGVQGPSDNTNDDGIDVNEDDGVSVSDDDSGSDGGGGSADTSEDDGGSADTSEDDGVDTNEDDGVDVSNNNKRVHNVLYTKIDALTEGTDGNLHIQGVLATPRVTLNNSLILPQELAKGHGMNIPLSVNHAYTFDESPANVVGNINLRWNDQKMRLEYDGTVTDKAIAAQMRAGQFKSTSISISVGASDFVYGFEVLKDIGFIEGSLTDDPAIPEATAVIMESINTKLANHAGELKSAKRVALFVTKQVNSSLRNKSTKQKSTMTENSNTKDAPVKNTELKVLTEAIAEQTAAFKGILNEFKASSKTPTAAISNSSGKSLPPTVAEVKKALEQAKFEALAECMKRSGSTNEALVASIYDAKVQELKKTVLTEAIDLTAIGTAGGGYWTADITTVPDNVMANLRDTADVKIITQTAKDIHFTLMARPTWSTSPATPPTVPSDYSTGTYPITDIVVTPSVYAIKQSLTDQAVASATPDFMAKLQQLYVEGANILLDKLIITQLDGASSIAATLYGDESVTAEANVTSSMTFAPARLTTALNKLEQKGFFPQPGEVVAVMHPAQMAALLTSTLVQSQLYYGTQPNTIVKVPMLFGIELRVSNQVSTGLGSPTTVTTYHAYVYLKFVVVGLGFTQDARIEVGRVVGELATRAVASIVAGVGIKTGNGLVKIITA